jgi:hypothetical protein
MQTKICFRKAVLEFWKLLSAVGFLWYATMQWTEIQSPKCYGLLSLRHWTVSKIPVTSITTHHRQNPLSLTNCTWISGVSHGVHCFLIKVSPIQEFLYRIMLLWKLFFHCFGSYSKYVPSLNSGFSGDFKVTFEYTILVLLMGYMDFSSKLLFIVSTFHGLLSITKKF